MKYYFQGNYTSKKQSDFQQAQESDLLKICDFLETEPSMLEVVSNHVFDTREGKQKADPNHSISRASARFEHMAIYRYWEPNDDPHFPHEITHLVAHTWAEPYDYEVDLDTWDDKIIRQKIKMVSTSFMQEGLAIAVDEIVFGRMLKESGEAKLIDQWVLDNIDQIPKSLVEVINFEEFCEWPNVLAVPTAASFTKYLLQKYGLAKYKQMYISLKETHAPDENVKKIEQVYKKSIDELYQSWLNQLSSV